MQEGPEQHQRVRPGNMLRGSVVHGQEYRSGCARQDGFQVLFVHFTPWNLFFRVYKTRVIKRDEVYKAHNQVPGMEQTAFA